MPLADLIAAAAAAVTAATAAAAAAAFVVVVVVVVADGRDHVTVPSYLPCVYTPAYAYVDTHMDVHTCLLMLTCLCKCLLTPAYSGALVTCYSGKIHSRHKAGL